MILVCGENLIDYILEPGDGGFPSYRATPGGSPYNTAMALGRQDIETGYVNPVSEDVLGQLLRSHIEASGVTCLADASSKPTSLAVISLDNGQPSYQFYHEDTADRQIEEDMLMSLTPAKVEACHIGGAAIGGAPDGDDMARYIAALSARGITITFDPNIRPAFIDNRDRYLERFETVLAASDLVKLSDEDIEWLYPGTSVQDAAKALFERADLGLLVLTMGSKGAIAFSQHGRVAVDAANVENLVDTVGAGDTFMATLVAGFAKRNLITRAKIRSASEDDIRNILIMAAKAAAINCTRKGCNPPTAKDLEP